MLRFMLDTNICIYVIKNRPVKLRERFNTFAYQLCISVITVAELIYGAEKSALPNENLAVVNQFCTRLEVLPFAERAARHYGQLWAELERAGRRVGLGMLFLGILLLVMGMLSHIRFFRNLDRRRRQLVDLGLLHGAVDDRHASTAQALDDLVLAEPGPREVFHGRLASCWTMDRRSASRNGLLSTLSAPAARNRSRSLAIEWALAMTIGIAGISALIRRIASSPSMPGMATSMRIIDGF